MAGTILQQLYCEMRRQIQVGAVGEVVQVFAPILPVAASRSEWRHSGGCALPDPVW